MAAPVNRRAASRTLTTATFARRTAGLPAHLPASVKLDSEEKGRRDARPYWRDTAHTGSIRAQADPSVGRPHPAIVVVPVVGIPDARNEALEVASVKTVMANPRVAAIADDATRRRGSPGHDWSLRGQQRRHARRGSPPRGPAAVTATTKRNNHRDRRHCNRRRRQGPLRRSATPQQPIQSQAYGL
jgi:hypothetical protein